jgi:hypothetical protein
MFFEEKKTIPLAKMVKRNDKTNTGEGGKGKKSRTVPGSTCHLLRLLRGSSVVWDLYRLTCAGTF